MYFTRQAKRTYWSSMIQEWEEGEEPQAIFCERKKINFSSFSSWRQKLKNEISSESNIPSQSFVEAKVIDDRMQKDEGKITYSLALKDGSVLTIPASCSSLHLKVLFTALGLL